MTGYYEIVLPTQNNAGYSLKSAHAHFRKIVLRLAGGFTVGPVYDGFWQDPEDGAIYEEPVKPYKIACDEAAWRAIVREAFELFPDQAALFTAKIGTAEIIEAKKTEAV